MRVSRLALSVGLGVICVTGGFARISAGDWPQWGGSVGRNMVSSETGLPISFTPGTKKPDGSGIDLGTTKNVKWVAKLGTQNYSSPAIAAGRVFIGTNDMTLDDSRYESTGGGMLLCLDEATGKLLWQLVAPKLEIDRDKVSTAFDTMALGVCGSPTVDGDRVYVVSNRGELLCLDVHGMANGNDGPFTDEGRYSVDVGKPPAAVGPNDADILWRFDIINETPSFPHDAVNSAVLVHGDLLYVGTGNATKESTDIPYPTAPSVIVLNKKTGKVVSRDDGKCSAGVFHGQWSSPALGKVGEKTLIFWGGGDGICYAYEALAEVPHQPTVMKTVWTFDCNPPEFRYKDGKPIDYWDGDKRRNSENKNDGLFYSPSEIIATPVFHNNRVYVAGGQDPLHGRGRSALHCIDATKTGDISKTGKVWSYEFERTMSTVAIANDLLFIADYSGHVHCLDLATGRPHWVHETKLDTWSSTVVADGKVYLGTRKGLCVLAAAKDKKVLADLSLGSAVRSSVVAANGVLYVASQRYLWAVGGQP